MRTLDKPHRISRLKACKSIFSALARALGLGGIFLLAFATCNNQAVSPDLIISEFFAGSLDVPAGKRCNDLDGGEQSDCRTYALEIRNPTSESVDLQNYAVLLRLNTSNWGGSQTDCATPTGLNNTLNGVPAQFCDRLQLSSSLGAENFLIISRDAYDPNLISPNFIWNRFIFDGNDAFGLARNRNSYSDSKCPSTTIETSFTATGGSPEQWCIIDLFGESTLDIPITNYSIAGAATDRITQDVFRRLPAVSQGKTNWQGSAGTNASDSDWIVVTSSSTQRDYSNFGILTPLQPTSSTRMMWLRRMWMRINQSNIIGTASSSSTTPTPSLALP